ncbi:MAG: choline/ethanolamine kinase family protein [Pseudomonadota bacterium]
MTGSFSREDVLALMPEWADQVLDIQPLTGGITNTLYRVRTGRGDDVVVRLHGARTEIFIDRDLEVENLRRLENTGVTPRLVRYLPAQRATLVAFIPGRVLKNPDFLDEKLWPVLVEPIHRVHRSGVVLPRVFEPLVEVRRLARVFGDLNVDYPEFDIPGTLDRLERLAAAAAAPVDDYVACHNDLLAENFVLAGEGEAARMHLIDWEYAGQSTPHYDLADMFQEIAVPRAIERELLRLYWQDQDLDTAIRLCDLHKPFPDIYWFLWSLIQRAVSTINFDYYSYGATKYRNAWANIKAARTLHGVRSDGARSG